ncbi:9033_t:CDS:2, partial [Cetraspora pellucida]
MVPGIEAEYFERTEYSDTIEIWQYFQIFDLPIPIYDIVRSRGFAAVFRPTWKFWIAVVFYNTVRAGGSGLQLYSIIQSELEQQEQGVQNNTLIVNNIDIRLKIEEWRQESKHILEILKQDLLRYNIIDTVSSSATKARCLFKDVWDMMVDIMEDITSDQVTKDIISDQITKTDQIKSYAKGVFAGVNSLENLRKTIKSNRSLLRQNTSDNTSWKKQVLKISK